MNGDVIEQDRKHAVTRAADERLLDDLIAVGEGPRQRGLTESELEAFQDMRGRIGRNGLSPKQREWCEQVADRIGVEFTEVERDAPLRKPIPIGPSRKEKLLPCEQPGYVKPVKPPGRRPVRP